MELLAQHRTARSADVCEEAVHAESEVGFCSKKS